MVTRDQTYSSGSFDHAEALLPKPTLRWARYAGEVDAAEKMRVRGSELYKEGDTVLVWVNEGDLYMVGKCMDPPQPTPENVKAALRAILDSPTINGVCGWYPEIEAAKKLLER